VTTTFWIVAALFCGIAILILLVPTWRHRKRGGQGSLAGVVVSVLIAPLAMALYFLVSDWDPEYAARASQETELLDQLARHLETNPDDLRGWRLLAASYMQLGRYGEGRAAYQRLWALTAQPDDELKLAYAESQILSDRATLVGEAGRLVEEVLAAHPGEPKALWYGGLVALEAGRNDAVRERWTSLLALGPPEDVQRVVRGQLAALGGAAAEGGQSAPAAVSGPEIRVSVTLGEGRAVSALGPNAQPRRRAADRGDTATAECGAGRILAERRQ
jgi:cytochrome c-type biogenesis protein CcmH